MSFTEQITSQLAISSTNIDSRDPEDDDDVTAARTEKHESDEVITAQSSSLRKKNVPLLEEDKKYAGKPVSRKQLEEEEGYEFRHLDTSDDDSEEEEDEDDEVEEDEDEEEEEDEDEKEEEDEDDEDHGTFQKEREIARRKRKLSASQEESFQYDDDDDGDYGRFGEDSENDHEDDDDYEDDEEESMEEDEDDDDEEEQEKEGGVRNFSKPALTEDAQKGQDTKHQLYLWDSCLEDRIKLQKGLQAVNKLPQPETFEELKSSRTVDYEDSLKKGQQAVTILMDALVTLQTTIYKKNAETKFLASADASTAQKKRPIDDDEEIPSDSEIEEEDEEDTPPTKKLKLEEYPTFNKKRHNDFTTYRNSTLQKWYDKTKLSTEKLSKGFSAFEQSALKQIQQVLSDKDRLIKRTQTKRSSYSVVGKPDKNEEDDENPEQASRSQVDHDFEIFDDDDFYHQMLRELIERKTADIEDPVERTRHWLEIQKLRSKSKKKVDRRASKGRKIRYHVYKKMVNFMAPDKSSITMTDTEMDALFSSLPNNPEKSATTEAGR